MVNRFSKNSYAIILLILVFSCAKRGSISGGPKDETPPVFIKANPPNYATNFKKKEIRIYFDEYIKLKDPQKQIIVSPPMDPKPVISPLGAASKFVKIKFIDTLLENTTYTINFGESIIDNNESNPNKFFKYVFSTGDHLDSLSLKGTIKDAIKKEADTYVSVMLYEENETYTDSIPFTKVPRYVTNTLDSTSFKLNNLKKGKYKLIALKEKLSNYTYEPKTDKIGFYEESIELPRDTAKIIALTLFKEIPDFKVLRPKQVSKNEIQFPYEGINDSLKIKLLSKTPKDYKTRVFLDQEKDTLHYWFKPFFEADSLVFEVANNTIYKDTLVTRFKDQYKDSLQLKFDTGNTLDLNKKFEFSANTPLDSIKNKFITLRDKDSIAVPFTTVIDTFSNKATLSFEKTESNTYDLQFLPKAIVDFYGNVNDTINLNFSTKKYTDYGTVFLTLEKVKSYPVLVQFTDSKEKVVSEKILVDTNDVTFDNLDPSEYFIRVIYDQNKNGKWDTGNYLNRTQAEEIKYFPKSIDVRANWEINQVFSLE